MVEPSGSNHLSYSAANGLNRMQCFFNQQPQEGEAMQNQVTTSLDDLVPYKNIPKLFPELFPPRRWEWLVKQRKHNGLAKAFRKVGRNLIVNVSVLAECIDEQIAD